MEKPASDAKINIARHALEAVLIVFSVLLALFLDNVFEERREQQTLRELIGHVTDEMQANLAIADEWLPYHRSVINKVDRYLESDALRQSLLEDDSIDYAPLMTRGLIQDFYSSAAWQLVQQSEVSAKMDFEVSSAISRAYLSQDNVNQTLQRFSDFGFDRATYDPDQLLVSLRLLRNLMQEIAGQENVLRANYQAALTAVERLETQAHRDAPSQPTARATQPLR